jgi:hypothetical protein
VGARPPSRTAEKAAGPSSDRGQATHNRVVAKPQDICQQEGNAKQNRGEDQAKQPRRKSPFAVFPA